MLWCFPLQIRRAFLSFFIYILIPYGIDILYHNDMKSTKTSNIICATTSYARTKLWNRTGARWADVNNTFAETKYEIVTNGGLNMWLSVNQKICRWRIRFLKKLQRRVRFRSHFFKTVANGYLKGTHFYSRFSLGTHRDYSQLHRIAGSGFSRFFLYIFAKL
jgi:hypothetical protein